MNIKSLAALAATVIATTAYAGDTKDHKCGAGSCGKKAHVTQDGDKADPKQASCSKKEGSCSKKEASCSKKEASCSKKDASCAKK